MELKLRDRLWKVFAKKSKNKDVKKRVEQWYVHDESFSTFNIDLFTEHDLDTLLEVITPTASYERSSRDTIRKINAFRNLHENPTGVKVKRLDLLVLALKRYIKPTKHKWLFHETADGQFVPYFVEDIEYHQAVREKYQYTPAHVTVSMKAVKRGAEVEKSTTFWAENLGDIASILLRRRGYYLETPAIVEAYMKEFEFYKDISAQTGAQFIGAGVGETEVEDRWYDTTSTTSLDRDGVPMKFVMDDLVDAEDGEEDARRSRSRNRGKRSGNASVASMRFWTGGKDEDFDSSDDGEEDDTCSLPAHPYVKVFDLDAHQYVTTHVNNLKPYVYDAALIDKLILSEEKKALVGMLIEGVNDSMEDIVAGKMRGVIVLATGVPGTGKTLTAEAFSESTKRPLYVVQCAQLGTDEEQVENSLKVILSRASRWQAILLIDEADVYIHERGSDIQQNAIVGVFLRVLEYYRGILFMTSNRADIIDDAIMSRATAWVQYDLPTPEQLADIWRVLSVQYKAELNAPAIRQAVAAFPNISGRTVRNLLKLARLLAARQQSKVDVKLLKYVSQFQKLDTSSTKLLERKPEA